VFAPCTQSRSAGTQRILPQDIPYIDVWHRHVISTIEPENLKTIQAVDFKKWTLGSRRISAFRPFLGLGIFTTAGADWHRSREMLRPNFARSQVGDLATFETHVNHLIAAVPKDGSEVDLSELFFRLTMDSATEFLLGESTESLTKDSEDGFADAFTRSQAYVVNMARWGGWAKLFPANKQWMQDKKFVHDFVDYYVRKALARRNELLQEQSNAEKSAAARYVFIDELVRQTTDPIRIRSELLNVLLAGRDTTASLLTNAWFMLSKRDDVWNRLQAEVSTLHGEQPSFDQLKDMKYLKAFLNETQRLYCRAGEQPPSRGRHHSPARWRQGRSRAGFRAEGLDGRVECLGHAPTKGLLR